jgi:predicted RNase H-like nuclease (RuvC/YqgF family)
LTITLKNDIVIIKGDEIMDNQTNTNPDEGTPQTPSYTFNKDGSVDIPIEGTPTRFVKESDLLKVKASRDDALKGFEAEKSKLQTDLDEANRQREESHQQAIKAQAEIEKVSERYKDYETFKTKSTELDAEVKTHKEKLTTYEKELASRISQSLISAGASPDMLKDKTLEQLRSLEEASKIFGGDKHKPANYDRGSVGGGQVSESPIDRANRILQENDEKGHRMGSKQVKVS